MSSARKTLSLVQICTRQFSRSAIRKANVETPSSKFPILKRVQKAFQNEDGLPVHLKGGFSDKALYQITLVMTAVGLALSGEVLYKLSVK